MLKRQLQQTDKFTNKRYSQMGYNKITLGQKVLPFCLRAFMNGIHQNPYIKSGRLFLFFILCSIHNFTPAKQHSNIWPGC